MIDHYRDKNFHSVRARDKKLELEIIGTQKFTKRRGEIHYHDNYVYVVLYQNHIVGHGSIMSNALDKLDKKELTTILGTYKDVE